MSYLVQTCQTLFHTNTKFYQTCKFAQIPNFAKLTKYTFVQMAFSILKQDKLALTKLAHELSMLNCNKSSLVLEFLTIPNVKTYFF